MIKRFTCFWFALCIIALGSCSNENLQTVTHYEKFLRFMSFTDTEDISLLKVANLEEQIQLLSETTYMCSSYLDAKQKPTLPVHTKYFRDGIKIYFKYENIEGELVSWLDRNLDLVMAEAKEGLAVQINKVKTQSEANFVYQITSTTIPGRPGRDGYAEQVGKASNGIREVNGSRAIFAFRPQKLWSAPLQSTWNPRQKSKGKRTLTEKETIAISKDILHRYGLTFLKPAIMHEIYHVLGLPHFRESANPENPDQSFMVARPDFRFLPKNNDTGFDIKFLYHTQIAEDPATKLVNAIYTYSKRNKLF